MRRLMLWGLVFNLAINISILKAQQEEIFSLKKAPLLISKGLTGSGYAKWSSDGELIAFETIQGDVNDLWIYDIFAEKVKKITDGRNCPQVKIQKNFFDNQFEWTSDPRILAFVSVHEGNFDIFLYDMRKNTFRQLTGDTSWDGDISWSYDGSMVAFVSTRSANADIYLKKVSRWRFSSEIQLTSHKEIDFAPSWSPDSETIAYTAFRENNYDIYTIKASGKGLQRITALPSVDIYPSWSPKGDKIAFFSDDKLCTIDKSGIYLDILAEQVLVNPSGPSWSPNAKYIAFIQEVEGVKTPSIIDLDTHSIYKLNINPFEIRGEIVYISLSPNGKMALLTAKREDIAEYWLLTFKEPFSRPNTLYKRIQLPLGERLTWSEVVDLEAEPEGGEAGEGGESGALGGDY